jgi:hypothetical protein
MVFASRERNKIRKILLGMENTRQKVQGPHEIRGRSKNQNTRTIKMAIQIKNNNITIISNVFLICHSRGKINP